MRTWVMGIDGKIYVFQTNLPPPKGELMFLCRMAIVHLKEIHALTKISLCHLEVHIVIAMDLALQA